MQGSIQTGSYVDTNGVTKYTTDVVANQVEFLERLKNDTEVASEDTIEEIEDFDENSIPL